MATAMRGAAVLTLVATLAACSGLRAPGQRAPVSDRSSSRPVAVTDLPPGAEHAGKPGYYSVRPGDTLIRIGLETGQNWRDIQRWNKLDDPNTIEVGQVLRVVPPPEGEGEAGATSTAVAPVAGSVAVARPLNAGEASAGATPAPASPVPSVSTAPTGAADTMDFIWPAKGTVIERFDETSNKGIDISGKLGEPVLAAADGRVVYAGAGLRGYGNLVILKHNNTFLTAYAHNQTLNVKEDQAVRKGQKIAEMGSSDADRVKLHFEVRRQGKPVDPMKLLPSR